MKLNGTYRFSKSIFGLLVIILIGIYSLDLYTHYQRINNLKFLDIGDIIKLTLTFIAVLVAGIKNKKIVSYIILSLTYIGSLPILVEKIINLNFSGFTWDLLINLLILLYLLLMLTSHLLNEKIVLDFNYLFKAIGVVVFLIFVYLYHNFESMIIVSIPIILAVMLKTRLTALLLAFAWVFEQMFIRINDISKNTDLPSQIVGLVLVSLLFIYLLYDLTKLPKSEY